MSKNTFFEKYLENFNSDKTKAYFSVLGHNKTLKEYILISQNIEEMERNKKAAAADEDFELAMQLKK